jgi:arabinogalactan endo-1,4-beta-galactosidase
LPQVVKADTNYYVLPKDNETKVQTEQIGIGATACDWFAQKEWRDPRALWNTIDPVPILAENGFNWLRVGTTMLSTPELENNPPYQLQWKNEYWSSREYALQVMKAGSKAGMHLDLFFFLSDEAAYSGHQKAPAQWANYTLEETASALKQYTYETTKYYKDKGLKIEIYEIGNEIEWGICGYSNDTKLGLPNVNIFKDFPVLQKEIWSKEATLLKAAIEGVKQADPAGKILLHVSTGQYPDLTEAFFQAMNDFGVPYDFAGLSYYPWTNYHPEIPIPSNCLELAVNAIAKLGKEVVITEFDFPSRSGSNMPMQDVPGYSFTPDGQSKWIRDFLIWASNNPQIRAVFYFSPDNFLGADVGPAALFTDDKNIKSSIYDFADAWHKSTFDLIPAITKSQEPVLQQQPLALR